MKRFLSGLLALVMAVSLLPQMAGAAAGVSRSYGVDGAPGKVEYHNDYTGLHITGSTDWFFTNDMEVAYLHYDNMDPMALAEMTPAQFAKLPVIYDMGASAMDSQDRFDISIYNTKHWKNSLIRKESGFIKYLRNNMGKGAKARRAIDPVELSDQTFQVQEYYFDDFVRYVAYRMRSDGYTVVVQFDSYDIEPERFWDLFNGGMLSDKISRSWEWDTGVYVNDFTGLTFHLWNGWEPMPEDTVAYFVGLTGDDLAGMDHDDFRFMEQIPDIYVQNGNDYLVMNIYNPVLGSKHLQSAQAHEQWIEEIFEADRATLSPWAERTIGGRPFKLLRASYNDRDMYYAYEYREDGFIVGMQLQCMASSPYTVFAMFDGWEFPGADVNNVPMPAPMQAGASVWENEKTGLALELPKGWKIAEDDEFVPAFYNSTGQEFRAASAELWAEMPYVADVLVYEGRNLDTCENYMFVRYLNRKAMDMVYDMSLEEMRDCYMHGYTTSKSRGVKMPGVELDGRDYLVVAKSVNRSRYEGTFTMMTELNEDFFIEIVCQTYDGTTLSNFTKMFR